MRGLLFEINTKAKTTAETYTRPSAEVRLFRTGRPAPAGKLVDGVSHTHSVRKAADLILSSRLSTVFRNWIADTDDVQLRAYFSGMLLAHTKAHEDLRHAFHAIWTPQVVKQVRREFRAYCGRSRQ